MSNHMFGGSLDDEAEDFNPHQYDDQPDPGAPEEHMIEMALENNVEPEETAEELVAKTKGKTRGDLLDEAVAKLKNTPSGAKTTPFPLRDTRLLIRVALMSGHQSGFPGSPKVDFVDEKREAERQAISDAAKAELAALGEVLAKEEPEVKKEAYKPVGRELKLLSAYLGTKPEKLYYPRHVATLPNNKKFALLQKCREIAAQRSYVSDVDGQVQYHRPNLAEIWNQQVFGLVEVGETSGKKKYRRDIRSEFALRSPSPMRHNEADRAFHAKLSGVDPVYREPGAPEQPGLVGIASSLKDQTGVEASSEWMKMAEENSLPSTIFTSGKKIQPTKCWLTEESLIIKRNSHDKKTGEMKHRSWRVGPNLRGLGLTGARKIVDDIACLTFPRDVLEEAYGKDKVISITVEGKIPTFYQQIIDDPDAWAILAAHTNHPIWGRVGKALIAWRDSLYFKLGEREVRDNQRIGAQIFEELKRSYPEHFGTTTSPKGGEK